MVYGHAGSTYLSATDFYSEVALYYPTPSARNFWNLLAISTFDARETFVWLNGLIAWDKRPLFRFLPPHNRQLPSPYLEGWYMPTDFGAYRYMVVTSSDCPPSQYLQSLCYHLRLYLSILHVGVSSKRISAYCMVSTSNPKRLVT